MSTVRTAQNKLCRSHHRSSMARNTRAMPEDTAGAGPLFAWSIGKYIDLPQAYQRPNGFLDQQPTGVD